MGLFYEYVPPPAAEQHARLVALRRLTARGIPCILWGEDALNYVHWVPTSLFDQQILVPDHLLESASTILQEDKYFSISFTKRYVDWFGAHSNKSMFPNGILLKHPDIPDDEPYKLEPLPGHILLLPQSYYGLNVRSQERFQSMVPPLDASNAGILVPKYHTFLEGLVAFMMHPPIDLTTPHYRGWSFHSVYIDYLIRYRVKYEGDPRDPPPPKLLPEERAILGELQTEEARWMLGLQLGERVIVNVEKIQEYKSQKTPVS